MGTSKAHSSPQGSTPNSSKQDELREAILAALNSHTFTDETAYSPALQEDLLISLEKIAESHATTLAEERVKAQAEKTLKMWQSFPDDGDFTNWLHDEILASKRRAASPTEGGE